MPLALRLTGKFKTAFPEGKPESKSDADKKDDKKEEAKPEDKAKDTLKECKENNAVVLLGDTDWLSDQFSVQVGNFFGQKIIQPFNGNLSLVQNLVEQMAGDQNLIGVRSRAISKRLRPIASDWPRSSASMPGYAPGVSTKVKTGSANFSARCIRRSALR